MSIEYDEQNNVIIATFWGVIDGVSAEEIVHDVNVAYDQHKAPMLADISAALTITSGARKTFRQLSTDSSQ